MLHSAVQKRPEGYGQSTETLIHRKRVSEGSEVRAKAGNSGRSIFETALETLRKGFLNDFGSFGNAEASGRVGTIDWDRGTRRKRVSEGSGASVRASASDGSIFGRRWGPPEQVF